MSQLSFDPTFWTWNNVKQILPLSYALEADKRSHWKNTDQDHFEIDLLKIAYSIIFIPEKIVKKTILRVYKFGPLNLLLMNVLTKVI